MSNNIQEMRDIAIDMDEGMNMIHKIIMLSFQLKKKL